MPMRISGLASGMDIDSMVKQMMKAQSTRRDQVYQKKVQTEWQQSDLIDLSNQLRTYRDSIFKLKLSNTTSPKSVSSSNSDAVTATATADATNTVHLVTVNSLAQGVSLGSQDSISASSSADKNTLKTHLGLSSTSPFVLKLNGKDITVDPTKSIYELVSSINNSGAGVKASYDVNLDRFYLNSTTLGADAKVDFSATTDSSAQELVAKLKLGGASAATSVWGTTGCQWKGTAGEVQIDGVTYKNLTSNSLTVAGVVYAFKQKTLGTGEPTTSLQVSPDIEGSVKVVKDFVSQYNEILNKLNTELNEKVYRDFMPLTDEQKSAMKDSDITLWQEKARSGLLRNESSMRELVSQMRYSVSDAVGSLTGKYKSLSSLGVTTGLYSEGGKLYLNEDTLRKALTEDPDVVSKVFGTTVTKPDPTDPTNTVNDLSNCGVAVRLYDRLKQAMDKIRVRAGTITGADDMSDLGKQLRRYDKQLDDMNEQLTRQEDQYYKQFTAMEQAIQKSNSQSSWLTQQLGGKG
ncbi:flagellar filament capping protein FliD [Heliobacillus mobilis]|uniref:Flagellar hook-associated protein 2 n=1 Tax=Heliobacterium mobile TaxID=28064 RepID=A0A6I3SLV6_HELMO|nr:flagellar filament capping protein FliD [Heliobacterium mobile]MTV49933.1 flagellar filament capping protein FliD [Heliobacterium mobile]